MREYLLVFLVAAAATYLLTVIAREIALRTGAVARVRDRDVHAEPTPYLGGLAMLGGLVAAYVVAHQLPFLSRSQPFVFHDARIVLIAGAMICAIGTLDDLFELDALSKLGGQVLAAGFLVLNGIQYILFPLPGGGQFALDPAQGALLTAFVVVATVNAVNMVDGLDGLATGVVGIGSLAFFAFCYQLTSLNNASLASTGALLSAMLAGVCAGFLPQHQPGPRLHGRQRLDADRPGAVGQRDHPDRPVLRCRPEQGRDGLAGLPGADVPAAGAADPAAHRADRRPRARGDPPDPGRSFAVRP